MKVIVFSPRGTRIYKNPAKDQYEPHPHFIVTGTSDLDAVRGLPPHEWELKNGKVVARSRQEISEEVIEQAAPQEAVEILCAATKVADTSRRDSYIRMFIYLAAGAFLHWLFS